MLCPRCRRENPPQARFCNGCSAPLTGNCPACGHANPPGSRFCNDCGSALGETGEGSRFASPESYTPRHLAEKILGSRGALEGERKHVTVLFADLKGSLELLVDRDPEEARGLLDPVLERMMAAVHRYEGTVNQVMGDGIMALFGAPLAHEDHAMRACYAALAMQESVTRYGDLVQRSHGIPIQIRVGLNSGDVVVRSIGSDLRMDYTAVGQTAHLAARMEQMAKPGSTLLTVDSLRLVEGYVHVRPLGPVPVKGLANPVEVYELLGPGRSRTRLQVRAAAAAGLTPCVGRDAELELLHRALAQARGGHGQVVAAVGEAGVGKSRLVWELSHSHRADGWLVLEAASVAYGQATPYLPVRELLKTYFRIEDRDDARRVKEKLTGKLLTLDESLRSTLPAFLALLDVPADDGEWRGLDPAERERGTRDAVRRILLRETEVQPLLLVFEDLHWIDPDSQAVLDDLVESLPTGRLLLMVNYRPGYADPWGSRPYYQQVRLDPLTPASAETLLRSLLGGDPALASLTALLIERTQGNPFFLEECVRTLVETGVLAGEAGARHLVGSHQVVQVPATVQAVLAARIDRLASDDKRLLQTAAVVGKDVPLRVLEAIAEVGGDALQAGLARLHAADLLYEARLFPEVEYTFAHALTHEVAYGGLLHERRRALHVKIVEALERLYPERLADQIDRLAHHAFRGEAWSRALTYLRQAAVEASQRSLDAATGGAESPGQLWWTGEHERALMVGQRDLAIGVDFGNFGGRIVAACRLGQTHHALGDYPRATAALRGVVAALGRELQHERFGMAGLPSVFARAWLGWCLGEQGEFADGLALAEEGLAMAEAAEHPYSLALAVWGLGGLHLLRGEPDRAVPHLERGLVVERVAAIPVLFPFIAAPLGAAYTLAGRVGEALRLLEEAAKRATAMRLAAGQAVRLTWLGEAHLAAARPDDAARAVERARELAHTHKERGALAYVLRLAGELAARRDPPAVEAAEATYREALTIASELGMRPLEARVRLGLGALLLGCGRRAEADVLLSSAAEALEAMGMPTWLGRARAALAALRSDPQRR
jgi:class 3 adenylate cyclase/tetratricopeptide (TPR) repeat protein